MPRADVDVSLRLTTDTLRYEIFDVTAHIAPNRDYIVFLLDCHPDKVQDPRELRERISLTARRGQSTQR
jgi:hypothetical protein